MNIEVLHFVGIATGIAVLTVAFWFFTSQVPVVHLFASPIGKAIVPDPQKQSNPSIDLFSGFLRIYTLYFAFSIAITLTGGTLGAGLGSVLGSVVNSSNEGLKVIFVSALLATATARLTAVYEAADIASYLLYLAIWLAGGAVYYTIANQTFMELASINYRAFPNALIWCALVTALVVTITELAVYARSDSVVTYALLSERIQQQAHVRQIFGAKRVVSDTNSIVAKEVGEHGLAELFWVTNEPPEHLDSVLRGLDVYRKKATSAGHEPDSRTILANNPNVRIIHGPNCRSIGNISTYVPESRCIESVKPFRVRFMVLNRRIVIVHLPMPFLAEEGERANTLHVIDSPAQVAIWRSKFLRLEQLLKFQS